MTSKLIILEGCDNTGKTTQIENICGLFYNKNIIHREHFGKVPNQTPAECRKYSEKLYRSMFRLYNYLYSNNETLILDRSHLGELVYAQKYRNYSGDYVLDIEKEFKNYYEWWKNVYLITLIASPKILNKREDGLSQSKGKISDIQEEVDLFISAHNLSNILNQNKLLINIDNLNINDVYKEIKIFFYK